MQKILALLLCCFLLSPILAQETFTTNDVQNKKKHRYLLTNATVHASSATVLESHQVYIENDKIISVGQNIAVRQNTIIIDVHQAHLYPAFIDLSNTYGLPTPPHNSTVNWYGAEQLRNSKKGAYNVNEAIKSTFQAVNEFSFEKAKAKALRKGGFGTVLSTPTDGIVRGTSTLISTGTKPNHELILTPIAGTHFSFDKGSSKQAYPISIMGSIALLRQTFLNANWYQQFKNPPFTDLSLIAINHQSHLPYFFEAENHLDIPIICSIGKEIKKDFIIKTTGDEYQNITALKTLKPKLIVPLNFPAALDIKSPLEAEYITTKTLRHWELAPSNPSILAKNSIEFCFTADGLTQPSDIFKQLRIAHINGLSKEKALDALTSIPAKWINQENNLGAIKKGFFANLLIMDKDLFSKDAKLLATWVSGEEYKWNEYLSPKWDSLFTLSLDNQTFTLKTTSTDHLAGKIMLNDSVFWKVKSTEQPNNITLSFKDSTGFNYQLIGWKNNDSWQGTYLDKNHQYKNWSLSSDSLYLKKETITDSLITPTQITIRFPLTAYGWKEKPVAKKILFKNTTVWTNEKDGVLTSVDVLIENGIIKEIGNNLKHKDPNIEVIDATGKHLTSGIIDEHSHIALRAVNEIEIVSAMVRMSDAIDPTDINIYHQLAGGVTASQLLHGSANPIGGQSAIVKLRWGSTAQEMLIKNTDPFIKFALGENVKKSYNPFSIRFPQTRMGVEQVYRDIFDQAITYEKKWKTYNGLSKKEKTKAIVPRKDLQLEAVLEIIRQERFITCHSYVQSEINMLMHVASDYSFKVNTFTHILEGYKVADKMKTHGVGASTFSDWWAYKNEVKDAIPYNAAIMSKMGIITAINSDDAEMGRRLNQEAAKSLKYGELSEEEAWKMVTLNPAKLLHLDQQMGSIKVGKDADIVLWSTNPLTIAAKAEMTFVDGIKLFDLTESKKAQSELLNERKRIINTMKLTKEKGERTTPIQPIYQHNFHCDDIILK